AVGTALKLLDAVPVSSRHHAVRGELLARRSRYAEAADALQAALDTAPASHPERAHRERRRDHFRQLADTHPSNRPDSTHPHQHHLRG
ncbi:MAG TPA: hypothetical protein VG497_14025, partial [Kribbella sp.]|nr:hypothetical protein [Kribbella sp.]